MVWAKFTRDFEDGFAKYQKGGVYDIHPAKFDVYTTQHFLTPDGSGKVKASRPRDNPICVRCEAPANEPSGKGRSGKRAAYRFLDSVATVYGGYGAGQVYDLPVEIGDKYVRRGLAEMYRTTEPEVPENAMRPSSRK